MAVRYLLDTNTASYVIKGNFPRVRERLLKVPMAEVGISAVTEAELRFGVARKPEAVRLKTAVEEFLLRVEILPWDSEAAQQYAQVRANLERIGEAHGQPGHDDCRSRARSPRRARYPRSCLPPDQAIEDRGLDQVNRPEHFFLFFAVS